LDLVGKARGKIGRRYVFPAGKGVRRIRVIKVGLLGGRHRGGWPGLGDGRGGFLSKQGGGGRKQKLLRRWGDNGGGAVIPEKFVLSGGGVPFHWRRG